MAFNLTMTAMLLDLDKANYTKRIKEHLRICFREAIQASVKAAAGPQFPVQTGMAKAAWRKVGQSAAFGKRIAASVDIVPVRNTELPRTNFPRGKSIEAGLETSRLIFEEENFRLRFRLSPGAFHYRKGLFPDVVSSFIRAKEVFRRVLRECYKRKFPKLNLSIRTRVRKSA